MRAVSVIRGDNNNDTEGHELRRSGGQERCSRAPGEFLLVSFVLIGLGPYDAGVQERCPGAGGNKTNKINGFKSESCLLEQLRVSENWRHLMAVEQAGNILQRNYYENENGRFFRNRKEFWSELITLS